MALAALAGGGACTGATEPGDVGEVTGEWVARVNDYLTIELTLVESAPGVVTGTGEERAVFRLWTVQVAYDTAVYPLTVEGIVGGNQVTLEIVNSELTAFIGLRVVSYRFVGVVRAMEMRGRLELVEPPDPGNPFSLPPTPGPRVALTFRRK